MSQWSLRNWIFPTTVALTTANQSVEGRAKLFAEDVVDDGVEHGRTVAEKLEDVRDSVQRRAAVGRAKRPRGETEEEGQVAEGEDGVEHAQHFDGLVAEVRVLASQHARRLTRLQHRARTPLARVRKVRRQRRFFEMFRVQLARSARASDVTEDDVMVRKLGRFAFLWRGDAY